MAHRILVTGGAGFIGGHLVERLVALGHDVVVADNLLTGSPETFNRLSKTPGVTAIRHDVTKPIQVSGNVDRIFHLASPASPRDYHEHPLETLDVGSTGTRNVLELAQAKGARVLLASTSEVYGDPEVSPQTESYWGHVNPIGPRSVYDEAKRFSEALTMAYHRTRKVDTRIIRIFNTYGPRMRPNDGRAIPNFLSQVRDEKPMTVFGDGSQTRSFCYVDDLVEGMLRTMEKGDAAPINLGNPHELTLLELAQTIQRLTGSKVPLEFHPLPEDDPKQRRPDIARAKRLLGWEPKVPLDVGLRRTIESFGIPIPKTSR